MTPPRLLTLLACLFLSACGGGGGSNEPDAPPVKVAATLVLTGEARLDPAPIAAGFLLITNVAELDALAARFRLNEIPQQYRSPNFAQFDMVYLEGTGDNDHRSQVRIVDAERASDGDVSIDAEFCGNALATTANHRPYALYLVPKVGGETSLEWGIAQHPGCVSLKRIEVTRVAAGDLVGGDSMPNHVIRSQAQLDAVLAGIPAGTVPAQFLAPDFSTRSLIVLGAADNDPMSYVRIVDVLENPDKTYHVRSEFCGHSIVFIPNHQPFALYATPVLAGEVRFEAILDHPPSAASPCVTAR